MTQRRSSDTVFSNVSSNLQYLCQLAAWLLEGIDFGETRLRSDCSWSAKTLVLAAFIWAWASLSSGDAVYLYLDLEECKKCTREQLDDIRKRFDAEWPGLIGNNTPSKIDYLHHRDIREYFPEDRKPKRKK